MRRGEEMRSTTCCPGFGTFAAFRWQVPPWPCPPPPPALKRRRNPVQSTCTSSLWLRTCPSQVGRILLARLKSPAAQPGVARHAPQHSASVATVPYAMSPPFCRMPALKRRGNPV